MCKQNRCRLYTNMTKLDREKSVDVLIMNTRNGDQLNQMYLSNFAGVFTLFRSISHTLLYGILSPLVRTFHPYALRFAILFNLFWPRATDISIKPFTRLSTNRTEVLFLRSFDLVFTESPFGVDSNEQQLVLCDFIPIFNMTGMSQFNFANFNEKLWSRSHSSDVTHRTCCRQSFVFGYRPFVGRWREMTRKLGETNTYRRNSWRINNKNVSDRFRI